MNKSFILITEWDGKKPPTTWYNRLKRYGLKTRGNKETGILQRRLSHSVKNAVIMQEGTIISSSESLIDSLFTEAKHLSSPPVLLKRGEVIWSEDSLSDDTYMEKINSVKHSKTEITYTVTCFECMQSYTIHSKISPSNCHCGSTNISYREGELEKITVSAQWDLETIWKVTRGNTGAGIEFHPYTITAEELKIPENLSIMIPHCVKPPSSHVRYYDYAYKVSLMSQERRLRNRINGITLLARQGIPVTEIAPKDIIDWVDIIGTIPPQEELFIQIIKKMKGE